MYGLARRQAAEGHHVSVVTLKQSTQGERLYPCTREGVRWIRLPRLGPRRYPCMIGLRDAADGADLVHVHGLDGLADQLAWRRRRPPIGISTHGGYFHTPRLRWLKEGWLRSITRYTFAEADAVWFSSESDRVRLAAARRSGEVLPNGVDLAPFATLRRRPMVGEWVVVGRVDVHKGVDDLIRALAHLPPGQRPRAVHVVGREAQKGLIRGFQRLARKHGVHHLLHFWGALASRLLHEHLSRAELALFPSRAEGFGIAVVEAMAARVPVVVSPIPALMDHVAGGAGYVVPFRKPARAAERLAALLGRDHRNVAYEGGRHAVKYSWPVVLSAHERAYREILHR